MLFPGEEQQQRVAAELDQTAAVLIGRGEQLAEHESDDVGDLLGSHPAEPGQPLRHLREARDVDEHHRAVDGLHAQVGLLDDPLDGEPRQERPQRGRAIDCHLHRITSLVGPT